MRGFLNFVEHVFRWGTLFFLAVIVVALTLQVFGRYFLVRGIPYTDEIAQTSLSWLTFIGVPWVYRIKCHIAIDLIFTTNRSRLSRIVNSAVHVLIALAMVALIYIGLQSSSLAMRIYPGTLGLSRFVMLFLPLLIGATVTVFFALEAALRVWSDPRDTTPKMVGA